MGITDMRPEQRVFHIDTECYIVYLGRHPNDYKPFLRIGNTPSLDQEIKSLIYSVVVTDNLTGNPLDEAGTISEIPDDEFRYIGDPETVETFKNFLEHHEIATGSYQANGDETKDEHGVYVYFYDDANLKLRFESKSIFDLHLREGRDRHYPQRCKEVKNHLLKDPVRHGRRALSTPGFFLIAGRPYVFDRNAVLSFALDNTTFFDLAEQGVDPDAVSTVFHRSGDLALERWLKRTRQKNARGRVLTDQPEAVRGLIDLFRKLPTKPGRVEHVRFDAGGTQNFHGLTVYRRDGHFLVDTHGGVGISLDVPDKGAETPGPAGERGETGRAAPSLEEAPTIQVDGGAGVWRRIAANGGGGTDRGPSRILGGRGNDAGTPILEGVPYRVHGEVPSFTSDLLELYLPAKPGDFTGVFTDEQVQFLDQLRSAFEAITQKRDPSGQIRSMRNLSKAFEETTGDLFAIVVHNARELLRVRARSSGRGDSPDKSGGNLDKALRGVVPAIDRSTKVPGLVCDLYVDAQSELQLFPMGEPVTADRLERHRALVAEMRQAYFDVDSDTFEAERERLYEVIGELHPKRSRERSTAKTSAASETTKATSAGDTKTAQETESATEETAQHGTAAAARSDGGNADSSEPEAAKSGVTKPDSAEPEAAKPGSGRAGPAGADNRPAQDGTGTAGSRARDDAERREDEGESGSSSRRVAVVAGIVIVLVLGILGALFAAGVLGGGGAADATAEGASAEDQVAAADSEDGSSVAETRANGPTDGDPADTENPDREAAETDGADAAEDPGVPAEELGDTSDVSPAIREFVESLDVADLPPGLRAREGPDGIIITILDIIRLANRIAVDNGYRELGAPPSAGPNPDWIYPGNLFVLPDESRYTVVSGDTLWEITARFIQEKLEERYRRYASRMDRYRSNEITRETLIDDLETLRDNTHSENFRNIIDQTIQEVQGTQ